MMPYHRICARVTRARNADNQHKVHILHKPRKLWAQRASLGVIAVLPVVALTAQQIAVFDPPFPGR
jgi:hypothetical protein